MTEARVQPVLVTSPPLMRQACDLLRAYFPGGTVLVWQNDGTANARTVLRDTLLSGAWPVCISFYNDYIFSPEEIRAFDCIVNIHPALPCLRGRGYDSLPLIDRHRCYGATLHFVSDAIDAGEIIEVFSRSIPYPIRYAEFRACTQELSLELLDQLLRRCLETGLETVSVELRQLALRSGQHWSGECLTSKALAALLAELRRREPDHPVLRDLPPQLQGVMVVGRC